MHALGAGRTGLLLGVLLLGCALPVRAGMRWGVELGPRFGNFTSDPPRNALAAERNENRGLGTLGGGVLAEWPVRGRLSVGGALRYEEQGAGVHVQVAQLFNGGTAYGLWSDEDLRLRSLTIAPTVRFGVWRDLRVGLSPDLSFLLQAKRHEDVSLGAPQSTFTSLSAQSTIFEQAGDHFDLDVTSDYQRVLLGLGVGLAWEHALAGQLVRLEGGYHRMLADPARDGSVDQQLSDLRLSLAWLH